MSLKIHALVEYTDKFDSIASDAEKENVGTDRIPKVALADIIAAPSFPGIARNRLHRFVKLTDIPARLVLVPTASGVGPNLAQVCASTR